jgi:cobyrinic acid a,c-diamide synthase
MTGPARIVVAGTASGTGKTTIATGLMATFAAQGLRVQGFKVGPDYIDPTYHRAATGRPSYNLDTWLAGPIMVRQRFETSMRHADLAIIEGVMGLFDGRKGTRDGASTAEIARLLNAPVLLVLDVAHMGQSAAAIVAGFQRLDPRVRLAGVILNRLASTDHEATVRFAISEWTDVPVVGTVWRDGILALPARYLGLVPAQESMANIQALGSIVARHVDVDKVLAVAQSAGPLPELPDEHVADSAQPVGLGLTSVTGRKIVPHIRLGLAYDDAFSFYYPETLEAFANTGIEIVPFSPLADPVPPADVDLLYFGGGFPEIFAAQLAENRSMLAGVRAAARRGTFIYAECGGLMYLGEHCIDAAGKSYALAGILPVITQMGTERAQLGYRELTMLRDTVLGPAGMRLRGHEFHWSRLLHPLPRKYAAYRLDGPGDIWEGYASETILASYIHVPLAAYPHTIAWLVERCLARRGSPQMTGRNDEGDQT